MNSEVDGQQVNSFNWQESGLALAWGMQYHITVSSLQPRCAFSLLKWRDFFVEDVSFSQVGFYSVYFVFFSEYSDRDLFPDTVPLSLLNSLQTHTLFKRI